LTLRSAPAPLPRFTAKLLSFSFAQTVLFYLCRDIIL